MKAKLLLPLVVLAFFTSLLLAFRFNKNDKAPGLGTTSFTVKKDIVVCGPDWKKLAVFLDEADIPPMPGSGTHTWIISTKNDSAQFYFNQGINMYYSFHIIEAMASFKKAARFDPGCAMLYWAQALAYGPNINDLGYVASPEALAATGKAVQLSGTATNIEKALITAMAVRYTADSTDVNRALLNKKYTEQMKGVYEKYGTDPDAQALYADAMMLEHPWDLWDANGTPRPWTPQIRSVLEQLLVKAPNHPGANHYYIHVMEPSPYFMKALPSAKRLGTITPGLSHTVHMPSHIYLRAGLYGEGVAVNEAALHSYEQYRRLFEPVTGNAFLYVIHNLHMQANNAMLQGNSKAAMSAAEKVSGSIPKEYLDFPAPLSSYLQYIDGTAVLVNVRFEHWQALMNMPVPAANHVFSRVLYHFGRGMALSANNKIPEAKNELLALKEQMKDSSLKIPFAPFSPAIKAAIIAEKMLDGTIALKDRRMHDAIAAFTIAADTEENMVYNEPRDWMLNPKHYLGNALLAANEYAGARKVFERDLLNNNENGWALFGLWQALSGEKKTAAAATVRARFSKAFKNADARLMK